MTDQATQGTDRSGETKARILDAALREFSAHGLAGARMDRIASAASVNKALLYYYFESKERLYGAALEMISAKVRDRTMSVFLRASSPGERVLRAALEHFDRILTQHDFQALMQHEMIRLHKGESDAVAILVKRVFAPVMTMFQAMVREGISSGELIDVDGLQIQLGVLGANVFYFLSAPIARIVMESDPFAREALAARRKALVEYLGQAIFIDRQLGAELAKRVLADTPMPEPDMRLIFWEKQ